MTTGTGVPQNSLLSRVVRPTYNWHEWLGLWEAAKTFEEMLGLLHVGFDVPTSRREYGEKEYTDTDRVLFYLSIADGWTNSRFLEAPTDGEQTYDFGQDQYGNIERRSPSELRQMLATKAFDMLCLNFFKPETQIGPRDEKFGRLWMRTASNAPLITAILSFFRAEKSLYSENIMIRNLSQRDQSHNEKQAVVFLLNLVTFLWTWKEDEIPDWKNQADKDSIQLHNTLMRLLVEKVKPWTIELLCGFGEINRLKAWILTLSEACIAKLTEIAMRNELQNGEEYVVVKDRPVETLDEACFVGSSAAWLLKHYELKKKVHARLTAIIEAENQRRDAERTLAKLTSKP